MPETTVGPSTDGQSADTYEVPGENMGGLMDDRMDEKMVERMNDETASRLSPSSSMSRTPNGEHTRTSVDIGEGEGDEASNAGGAGKEKPRRFSVAGALEKRKSRRERNSRRMEEASRASEASDEASRRAQQALHASIVAQTVATRTDWEARAMSFLAAGNARVPSDGTFIKTWLRVHDEMRDAESLGVPLSEAARSAIIKMGTAEKAIKAASASAIAAAERANDEVTSSKKAREREKAEARSETDAERARHLTEEAAVLAQEAMEREKLKRAAIEEIDEARRQAQIARWGAFSFIGWRQTGGASQRAALAAHLPTGHGSLTPAHSSASVESSSFLEALCGCLSVAGSSRDRVGPNSPPTSPGRIDPQIQPTSPTATLPPALPSPRRSASPKSVPGSAAALPQSQSSPLQETGGSGVPSFRGGGLSNGNSPSVSMRAEVLPSKSPGNMRPPSEELQQKMRQAMQPRVRRWSFNEVEETQQGVSATSKS